MGSDKAKPMSDVSPPDRSGSSAHKLYAALLGMIILTAGIGVGFLHAWEKLKLEKDLVANLSQQLADLEGALAKMREQNQAYASSLEQYQQIVRDYQERMIQANVSTNLTIPTYPLLGTASVIAPAVRTVMQGFSASYEGVATTLSLEIVPGKGRVLVSTKPLMGEVFQDTAVLATETAERLSGKSLDNYDLIFSIEAPAEIPAVDGPSAGAAMCLLVLSLINRDLLKPKVAVTGTINPDGTVGEIGGLLEKAQAAKRVGASILLVSEENSRMTVYKEATVTRGRRSYRTYIPVEVSAEEYIEENVGIDVEFAHDVEQLLILAAVQA